jgi:spore coat polysaccharide biosynthesis predicted glycosyltransferase SpsG
MAERQSAWEDVAPPPPRLAWPSSWDGRIWTPFDSSSPRPGSSGDRPSIRFEVAGPRQGCSQFARSLALADALEPWADVSFSVINPGDPRLSGSVGTAPSDRAPDAVIIDTPNECERERLVAAARDGRAFVVVVTDGRTEVDADVIICPGPQRPETIAGIEGGACTLAGPSFAMVHPAFVPRRAAPTSIRRAAVALGERTAAEALRPVLDGLLRQDIEVDVLLQAGPDLPRFPSGVNVYVPRQAEIAARVIASADIAIVSPGSASLETLATATPMGVIAESEGDAEVAECYERLGAGVSLGLAADLHAYDLDDLVIRLSDDGSAHLERQHQVGVLCDASNGRHRVSNSLKAALA